MRAVQPYLQISLASVYMLIHAGEMYAGEMSAVKLGTKTIRVNRRVLDEYLQRASATIDAAVA